MAINKVKFGDETLIDLTNDSVTPQSLLKGATAHNAAGEQIEGAVAVAPASNTVPLAPEVTGVAGTEEEYARGDHRHPKEVLVATLTGSGADEDPYVSNPAPDKILAAAQTGKAVKVHFNDAVYSLCYEYVDDETGECFIQFSFAAGSAGNVIVNMLTLYREDSNAQWIWSGSITDTSDLLSPDGDGSDVTAAFTAASTRANIATGEKLGVLFGKIAKWLGDLKALAFKDKVAKTDLEKDVQTSLDNIPTIPKTTNLLKGTTAGTVSEATPGTDYITPEELTTAIQAAIQSTWEASY